MWREKEECRETIPEQQSAAVQVKPEQTVLALFGTYELVQGKALPHVGLAGLAAVGDRGILNTPPTQMQKHRDREALYTHQPKVRKVHPPTQTHIPSHQNTPIPACDGYTVGGQCSGLQDPAGIVGMHFPRKH